MRANELLRFNSVPACATKDQWKEWYELARRSPPLYGFCTDCTPQYQKKMIADNRCKFPGIKFRVVYDEQDKPNTHKIDRKGGIEGYLPRVYIDEVDDGF
jgi:hypothetical protein